MRRNPYIWFAFGAVGLALICELGTRDLGHEFTWFNMLSQQQSAWVRYCVFSVAVLLTVAAIVHRRRVPPGSR
jgi:hypothetical protein